MNMKQHKKLTEREIDERVIAEANDDSAWEKPIRCFAGAWSDMPKDVIEDFMRDIKTSRNQAFGKRGNEDVKSYTSERFTHHH